MQKTSPYKKFVPQFSNAIYTVLFVQRDPEIRHLINLEQMLAQEMCRNNKPELLIELNGYPTNAPSPFKVANL
jgi:hypothetical protein